MQINVVQCLFAVPAVLIRETHVIKINASIRNLHHRFFRVRQIRLLIEYLRDTSSAGRTHGQHDKDHGKHHQRHQDAHHITEHGGKFPCGQAATHNETGAKPGQCRNTSVYDQHHHRIIQRQNAFRLDKQFVQPFRRSAELLVLMLLTYKSFDNTNRGYIFLYTGVQIIISTKNLVKDFCRLAHDENQCDGKHHHGYQKDAAELQIDKETHRHAADEHQRCAHRNPQDHLIRILHIGHVRRHTGHQSCGTELINIRK